jgi:ribonuclease P protein component
VLAKPNTAGYPRLAVIISKKTVAGAVARNYIKRSLREIFRLQQHGIENLDVVVHVQKGFQRPQLPQVSTEFCALVHKLQLRCRLRSASLT